VGQAFFLCRYIKKELRPQDYISIVILMILYFIYMVTDSRQIYCLLENHGNYNNNNNMIAQSKRTRQCLARSEQIKLNSSIYLVVLLQLRVSDNILPMVSHEFEKKVFEKFKFVLLEYTRVRVLHAHFTRIFDGTTNISECKIGSLNGQTVIF